MVITAQFNDGPLLLPVPPHPTPFFLFKIGNEKEKELNLKLVVDSNQLQKKEIILFTTVSFPQKLAVKLWESIKPVMPQLNFVHGVSSAFFGSVFNFSCLHRIA